MGDREGSELPEAVREALVAARPEAPDALARRVGLNRVLSEVLGADREQPAIGRFLVESKIKAGGMGVVYRARDPLSDRPVAVKLLDGASGDPERLGREARILAGLRHPGIVRHVDHGLTPAGEPYLVMEWLDGIDLGERLRRAGLTVDEAVQLAIRLADALAEAHRGGVVHRDLKPGNVVLPDGRLDQAKLIDFGVARPQVASGARLTRSGVLVGTPSYMAPEQVRGAETIDGRADLFALGCTLHECLLGRPAFIAEHLLGVLARVLFQDPPHVSDVRPEVPRALGDLVARLLSKDPDARPAGAAAVAAELRALGHLSGGAPPESPVRTPTLSTAEQQVVSVVLVGLPEGAAEDGLRAIARQAGASLERVTGGTLVAAFSARSAAVDQAMAAARFALALRPHAPQAPIVVATGRGVAGRTLPVGDAIDRGALLLDDGEPGVWVDQVSAALLEGRFEIERGPRRSRLIGRLLRDAPARTLLGKATPCVGREHELGLLDAALADCAERPLARAVLITAPAGVGKSRLAHEWQRGLARGPRRARVLTCRGEPMSAGAPFVLAAQIVRRGAALPDDAPEEAQRRALASALAQAGVDQAERARIATFLAELVGVAPRDGSESEDLRAARSSPLLMGDQIRLAWEDWLDAECAAGPLVIVIEDLHWGDAPSVKLIDAALRGLRERPLMVLALTRPEVHDAFPSLWSGRGVQEVRLPELSRGASEELVRAVLGAEVDAETIAWISERAGGHALYLEEVIRAVAEGRRERIPASVLAMVQVRMAGLPSEERRVLRAASVFGEVFWRGGVAALVGRDEEEVAELLDELASRETIHLRRRPRFPGQAEYGFRHALFREAAAAMLTDADRELGHRLAADWLLAAGERQALVLAEHLERGGDAARAAEWYVRAAEEALLGNDFDGALALAARARALGAAGELLGCLHLVEAEAHIWRADAGDAEACALRAIGALPAGTARWYDAVRTAMAARVPARRELLDRVVPGLEQPPPAEAGEGALRSYIMTAVIASKHLSFHGQRAVAWRLLEQGEAAAATMPAGDAVHGWTLRARGSALLFDGKHDEALPAYLAASRLFEQIGDLRDVGTLGATIGWLQATELGLHADAVVTLRQSLALAQRVGLPRLVSSCKQNLGVALMHLGQYDEARALIEETVGEFELAGNARLAGGSRFYLTLLHTRTGELARAEEEALAALELAREVPTTRACTLAAYARALLAAGRPADALERARASAAILEELGGIEEGESLILLALAEALHASGEIAQARATIARAHARLEERAARIGDPHIRRCFLDKVPEHARTGELARAWAA